MESHAVVSGQFYRVCKGGEMYFMSKFRFYKKKKGYCRSKFTPVDGVRASVKTQLDRICHDDGTGFNKGSYLYSLGRILLKRFCYP